MGTQRAKREKAKRRIECGAVMRLTTLREGDLEYEGYQCQACGHVVLTLKQLKAYRLATLQREVSKKRKVVRIDNSLGIRLPAALAKLGIKEGRAVKVTLLDENHIQLRFVK